VNSTKNKIKLALLISGNGTNAENIIRWAKTSDNVEVVLVLSDDEKAFGLTRARNLEIPCLVVPSKGRDRLEHERLMVAALQKSQVDWVCLCGFKRIVTEYFLKAFPMPNTELFQVINIHPALCPSYPGLHAYERAYNDGVKISGVTVHFVDQGMDTGPIILQEAFARLDEDTLEDFSRRGMSLEYQLYPKALELIGHGRLYPHKKGMSWYVSTQHTA
jgi:phosphoribosylglycinamide formyltransferase 1